MRIERFRMIGAAMVGAAGLLAVAACGAGSAGDSTGTTVTVTAAATSAPAGAATGPSAGVRRVGAEAASAQAAGRAVLDIRTPEEFGQGHLAGAELIDFYGATFADEIAALDRSAPYLLYCRSGNRSGQAVTLMRELGFADVVEVEGGILAWTAAGLPVEG